jgi:large subunit ribosomal protein L18e
MISKTKIKQRIKRKTNLELVQTINLAKKNNHLQLAKILLQSARKEIKLNLEGLDKIKENKILVPGKVLGSGKIDKKMKIIALGFSKKALELLKNSGCETKKINEELINNPKLEGVTIIE